jgi:hypothetical protein|tara:strand:- start:2489 stop:2605 length:117 start_codon:yes stop_codon:yes gene_type:complete
MSDDNPTFLPKQKFRHKETGEIVTSVPLSKIREYEKID